MLRPRRTTTSIHYGSDAQHSSSPNQEITVVVAFTYSRVSPAWVHVDVKSSLRLNIARVTILTLSPAPRSART